MRHLSFIILFVAAWSCGKQKSDQPKLELTADELVFAIVQLYTTNAAININDATYRDSTSQVYFEQIAKIVGKPIDVIKSDLQKLQSMPDSLLVLENRALDTLRAIQQNQITKHNQVKF
jgi:hypothetical protein